MNNAECNAKGCVMKMLISVILVFIWLIASGYVIHHIWLMPTYEATSALWRPADEMKDLMPWMIVRYAVLALIISGLFCKIKKAQMQACSTGADAAGGKKCCPIQRGICFGIMIGLLMGAMRVGVYLQMPIPGALAVKWVIGDLIEGIGAGLILSLLCKKKDA